MKKTPYSCLVSIALILSLLVGCGTSSTPNNDSNQVVTDNQTQVTLPIDDNHQQDSTESETSKSNPSISGDNSTSEVVDVPSRDESHDASTPSSTVVNQPASKENIERPVDIDLSSIPEYSGTAYTAINNNIPYFSTNAFPDAGEEFYSPLDSLGRCVVAYATVGKETMPTEPRGSIGMVKPTGWHTIKYDCVDGKYLYNRCHLIGYQLTAENANTSNLITGTRYLNIQGMLPFENMAADYVKETSNHVAYRVTPIFEGNNLVSSGVVMEGYSIEDAGKGVCFCVFAYNVQPGVSIDYTTGTSELTEQSNSQSGTQNTTTSPGTDTPSQSESNQAKENPSEGTLSQTPDKAEQTYILNTNTKKFHFPYCSSIGQMKESNKQEYTGNRDSLINQGYAPCKKCNP